jgi:hypothetical protein
MVDAPAIPRGFRAKIRWVLDHHPWIWLLVAVEQFATGNIKSGVIFLIGWIANLFIYEMWDGVSRLAKRIMGRRMAFAFIAIGGLCLAIGIGILATQSAFQDVRNATVNPMRVTQLSEPAILTDEEKQFRIALRRFVLSNISEINQSFGNALSIPSTIASDIENRRSNLAQNEQEKMINVINIYNELIRVQFFPNVAPIINASQKNVEDIDPTQLASLMKKFFDGYRNTQISFKYFLQISELDPTKTDLLEKWLSSDARALNALRDLKSFPDAKVLDGIDEGYFPTRTGSFGDYLRPSRRGG